MSHCPYCNAPLASFATSCPTCYANFAETPVAGSIVPRGGTLIESPAVGRPVRESFGETPFPARDKPRGATPTVVVPRHAGQGTPPLSDGAVGTPPPSGVDDDTLPYVPVTRPPELRLCALDDGSRTDGEWFRIRTPQFVIGRTEGHLQLSHDDNVSGRHCEIVRRVVDGRHRYYLRDLNSRNGTFIRVTRAFMRADAQYLIGARRYVYRPGAGEAAQDSDSGSDPAPSTRGWEAVMPQNLSDLIPSLVELTPRGEGRRFPLKGDELTLGRDRSRCGLCVDDDPFVSPAHARLSKDKRGRWQIENLRSLNGLWLRIDEVAFDVDGEFQIGEQRFLLRFGRRISGP